MSSINRRTTRLASVAALTLAVSSCSLGGGTADDTADEGTGSTAGPADKQVVLATHESWNVPAKLMKQFTRETGYEVTVEAAGDAGALTNKLVLTKGSPIGDVVFGVDNTFASRAVEEGVFADHEPADQPASASMFEMPDQAGNEALTPVDFGDVCMNVDDVWFQDEGIEPPKNLADLTEKTYQDLFVTPGATTSSPGLAFLLATIAEFGEDGWEQYWEELMANGTRITSGWTDAYTVDFTAGGGDGDRPIVLSYASSPPFTIPEGGTEPTTSALLDTCYRQVEYAGVLEGAENPEGAQAFVDFMVGPDFQAALPENMYVFPVDESVELPDLWARWAKVPDQPLSVDPAEVAANRDEWLTTWGEITTR
ncbi:MAG TPA: thiamine ABC transporter substrate-binding protein [Nocardioidaceae bacterium]|nr:thiamine ABC transporter substrate-binding protein [Nocardioidaceae bacterium]